MKLYDLPISQVIADLNPEQRRWFEELCNSPHLADATTGEIFAMVWAFGYIGGVLAGELPFEREKLYQVLRIDAG